MYMNVENAANRLEGLFAGAKSQNPSDVYEHLRKLMDNYRTFFQQMTPIDYLSLTFYLWSKINTGNFDLAKATLSNLLFFRLLKNTGDLHSEECEDCGGSGEISCDECDGDGYNQCDDCDGDGKVECSECDGTGKVEDEEGNQVDCDECDGEGTQDCDTCDGNGTISCNNCNGGNEECSNCYGEGSIEMNDETDYEVLFGCTWDPGVIERAKNRVGQHKVFHKDSPFDPSKYLIFSSEEGHNPFMDDMRNDWYCLEITKKPNMKVSNNFRLEAPKDSKTFDNNFRKFLS